jgi:hypothetical protein
MNNIINDISIKRYNKTYEQLEGDAKDTVEMIYDDMVYDAQQDYYPEEQEDFESEEN